jgi:hypothetical protein
MNRLALFVALGLLAGAAHGSTFELSDPANEMYTEPAEGPTGLVAERSGIELCAPRWQNQRNAS